MNTKSSIISLLILLMMGVLGLSNTPLEEYCENLLAQKETELLRLEAGEKNVEGYAIFGNSPPIYLITGDDIKDQWIDSNSRIKILKIEIASIKNILSRIRQNDNPVNVGEIILQGIADSHIYQYTYSNWNRASWGAYEFLGAGYHPTGGEKRAFLKFDIGNIRPNDIGKATLRLYQHHKAGSVELDLGVYEIKESWEEGKGTYKPQTLAVGNEICWINQPDFETTLISSFSPGSSVNQWVEVDVSQLVRDWAAGTPNHGLMIKAIGPLSGKGECNHGFYSREYEDERKRPQLIITPISKEGDLISTDIYNDKTTGFEFTDNFENGSGNWDVSKSGAKVENGQLFWQEGNHNGVYLNVEVPMGDLVIEFDGWTSANGIAVEWKNGQNDGYNTSLGAYYNTGSYIGHIDKGKYEWTIYKGAHLTVNKWQHYKFMVDGYKLKAYLDHQLIGEHELQQQLSGMGQLYISGYGTKIGIDNVRIYELKENLVDPSSSIGSNINDEIKLEKLWIHELRDIDDKRLVGNSLAIGIDGAIYYVAQAQFINPMIHAINKKTGKILWKTEPLIGDGVGSDIVVGDDGTIYIVAGHQLYAFDHRTGSTKWIWEVPEALPNPDDPDRMVSTRAGLIYLALTDDGNLITTTGSSGHYYRGIYGVTKNGKMYFHNLKAAGTGISGGLSIGKNNTVYYLASDVFLSERGNYLLALNINTGKIKWTKKIYSVVTGSNNVAVMDNGNIFCSYPVNNHADKAYYILNGETGRVLWKSSEKAEELLVKLIGPDGSMYIQRNALRVDNNTGKRESIFSGATLGAFTADNHIIGVYGRGKVWGRNVSILDPNGDGEPLATINIGSVMGDNMVISDEGVIYAIINNTNYPSRVPTQICAIQGHAPLAKNGWPRKAHDNRNTSNINKGSGTMIGDVGSNTKIDGRVGIDPDWDEEDALNPELQAAYERYIAAYNRLTRLMAEGKGETEEARQAYDAYILAKKKYNEKYNN